MDKGLYSAIDANINRAMEGVRVCEDLLRFSLRFPDLSGRFKEIRHRIRDESRRFHRGTLLWSRDVDGDARRLVDHPGEIERDRLEDLFNANIRRAIEAVRALEEYSKKVADDPHNAFQEIRFSLYSLEKEAVPRILRQNMRAHFSKALYAILDSRFVPGGNYRQTAEGFIKGGASVIQLRMKDNTRREISAVTRDVAQVCRDSGALFILNDYPDIAMVHSADGVHLGQDDLPVHEARAVMPAHMLIGVSTHSPEEAAVALGQGPDYIAIGPVFDTSSKAGAVIKGIGLDCIGGLKESADVPIVAIGGIDAGRAGQVIDAGADAVAVISALYRDGSVEKNCRRLVKAIARGSDEIRAFDKSQ